MKVPATEHIEIVLNGDPLQIEPGLTVLGLLSVLGIEPARVAVELNRKIVRQSEWPQTFIEGGSTVEVVQFVGGG